MKHLAGHLDLYRQQELCKLMLKHDTSIVSVRLSQDFYTRSMIQRKYSFADRIASIGTISSLKRLMMVFNDCLLFGIPWTFWVECIGMALKMCMKWCRSCSGSVNKKQLKNTKGEKCSLTEGVQATHSLWGAQKVHHSDGAPSSSVSHQIFESSSPAPWAYKHAVYVKAYKHAVRNE